MPDSSPLPPWFWYGVAVIGLATTAAIGWAVWRMVQDTQRALVRTSQAAANFADQIRSALQETFGLTPRIESLCHHLVHLPMSRSVDSLNVASASAIFLHELKKTFR